MPSSRLRRARIVDGRHRSGTAARSGVAGSNACARGEIIRRLAAMEKTTRTATEVFR
ncbi:hypothetical protein [Methylobacterium sp. Leaf108]|uniref:hypothetical protein n=1 Tax=Methylobacterium sp. Leaf108 TaxID=1736256 RepID=UPI000A7EECBF|nr:hypothetical protein [Methylobacterium sp. Leaf108]